MFNRKVLKSRAKEVLATSYWQTLGTILLFYLATAFISNFFTLKMPPTITIESPGLLLMFAVTILMRAVIQFAASVFLTLPLQTGLNRYFLEYARGNVPELKTLVYAFRSNYKKVLSAVLAKQLIVSILTIVPTILAGIAAVYLLMRSGYVLPSTIDTTFFEQIMVTLSESPAYAVISIVLLVLLIPAIIKIYDYYLVEYIIADDSSLSWRKALEKSKQMMHGNRFATFVLGLSFIGWTFLGLFLFGIGSVFVTPYIMATDAQLYLELSGKTTYEPNNDFEF